MRKSANGTVKKTKPTSRTPKATGDPTEEEIQKRAYQIYQGRGGAPKSSIDDWLQAERELRAERVKGVPD